MSVEHNLTRLEHLILRDNDSYGTTATATPVQGIDTFSLIDIVSLTAAFVIAVVVVDEVDVDVGVAVLAHAQMKYKT